MKEQKENLPLNKAEIAIVFFLALFGCIIVVLSIIALLNLLPVTITHCTDFDKKFSHWQIIIIFSIFIFPTILENILIYRDVLNINNETPILFKIAKEFFFSASVLLLIFYFMVKESYSLSVIGIRKLDIYESLNFILYSYATWFVFGLTIKLEKKILGRKKRKESKDDLHLYFRCVTLFDRIISVILIPISVLSEEVLYRGYIVLMLGMRYQSIVLFSAFSLILFVLAHLYQGKERIISNVIFSFFMIVITIVTGSIVIPIFVHLLNNYSVVFLQWRVENKKNYKLK